MTLPPPLALPPQVACPLAGKTSFKMGGAAEWLLQPSNLDELQACLAWAQAVGLPWWLLGRGTNLLISDVGLQGVVIKLAGDFTQIRLLPKGQLQAGAADGDDAWAKGARKGGSEGG